MRDEIIIGLDVGSYAIRAAVGQRDRSGELRIIGVAENPSEGINKGIITSFEDAVSSVSSCLEKAERLTGVPIESAWVGISGNLIISQKSKGIVAVSKANGEIGEEDVERAIEAARMVATPPNYEILHVIPRSFAVDNQAGIRDPLGMTGVRLEVEAQIIQGLSSQIKNLTKCIYRTGVDIEDLVYSILAAGEAALTERQKELGVVLINIGKATTSLAVFEEGDLLHTATLLIGGEHVTSDIAIGLRISIDAAEKIKLEHGTTLPQTVSKKEEINLADFDANENEILISKKYVSEIIEARVEEIFEKIDAELKKIGRSGLLPAGAVLVGGGAKIPGIVEVAKRKLRLPVSLGYPKFISVIDKINDLSFMTALGLVMWGNETFSHQKKNYFGQVVSHFRSIDNVTKQMKKWFKSLIP
jgi:cell division protein FtsA